MAVLKTWIAGEQLTAADLNAEFVNAQYINHTLVADGAISANKPVHQLVAGKMVKAQYNTIKTSYSGGGSTVDRTQIVKIDTDKVFMVSVTWSGGSGAAYVVCGTINGSDVISWGTAQSFAITYNTSYLAAVTVDVVDSTHVIVATNRQLRCCSISGTTVTVGASSALAGDAENVQVRMLSSTLGICLQLNITTPDIKARAFTISGTTITPGSDTTVKASVTGTNHQIVKLTSTTGALIYQASTTNYARTFSISGTTITLNTEMTVDTSVDAGSGYPCREAIELSATAFMTCYGKNGQTVIAYCTVSGTTITADTLYAVGDAFGASGAGTVCLVWNSDKTEFLIIGIITTGGPRIIITSGTWDSTNKIRFNKTTTLKTADFDNPPKGTIISAAYLDNHRYCFSFTSSADLMRGSVVYVYPADNVVGVLQSVAADGETKTVINNGIMDGFSGLENGATYYADILGDLTKTPAPGLAKIGEGRSATTMLVDIENARLPFRHAYATATGGTNPADTLTVPAGTRYIRFIGSISATNSFSTDIELDLAVASTVTQNAPVDNSTNVFGITLAVSGSTLTVTGTSCGATGTLNGDVLFYS